MIISHKHKFIFTKPHKTAGTSVELMLSRICGPKDIITPLGFDPDPKVREKHRAKPPQNYYRPKPIKYWQMNELFWFLTKGKLPDLNYWEHLPADGIKEYVGEVMWDKYFKISLVRNPWDHAVSMYEWMSKYGFEEVDKKDFYHFVRYHYKLQWPFYTTKGLYDIDFMIRFEHLSEDIKRLAEKFPELENINLPVTKTKTRETKAYQDKYNKVCRDIIYKKNIPLIDKFNYSYS